MVVPFFVVLRAFSLRSSRVCVAHSCRVLYQYYRERGTAFSWQIILQRCSPVVGKPRRMSRPVNLSDFMGERSPDCRHSANTSHSSPIRSRNIRCSWTLFLLVRS